MNIKKATRKKKKGPQEKLLGNLINFFSFTVSFSKQERSFTYLDGKKCYPHTHTHEPSLIHDKVVIANTYLFYDVKIALMKKDRTLKRLDYI